ncbi:hypothetical protein MKEN_00466300 [Mycena kentingensis (nom. inval.)]|nr:hypothetical protein MKEN_00466300 [Mycena kentingensis (nom. inval.)]
MADVVGLTGFIVALVALTISFLQFLQQYMASSGLRSKVKRAAIGNWAKYSRRRFSFWDWKLVEEYRRPDITWEAIAESLDQDDNLENGHIASIRAHTQLNVAVQTTFAAGAGGTHFHHRRRAVLYTRTPDRTEVPVGSLSRGARQAVQRFNQMVIDRDAAREVFGLASWSNMLNVVLGDASILCKPQHEISGATARAVRANLEQYIQEERTRQNDFFHRFMRFFRRGPGSPADAENMINIVDTPGGFALQLSDQLPPRTRNRIRQHIHDIHKPQKSPVTANHVYVDADTIPAAFDNPLIHIRLSDLISIGIALGVNLDKIDPHAPAIHMSSSHCTISTQNTTAGPLVQFTTAPDEAFGLHRCLPLEARVLVDVAKGKLLIGSVWMRTSDWGYNSVHKALEVSLSNGKDEDGWQSITLGSDFMRNFTEGDQHGQWNGHWKTTHTPRMGMLMALVGNPAVAHGFCHSAISEWGDSHRN